MVVRLFLVQFVLVRIQVGQPKKEEAATQVAVFLCPRRPIKLAWIGRRGHKKGSSRNCFFASSFYVGIFPLKGRPSAARPILFRFIENRPILKSYLYPMNSSLKLFLSYLLALAITIILAYMDSDPIISYYSIIKDVFFMSILIWGLGLLMYGVKLLAQSKKN